jgi:hypothetical protein
MASARGEIGERHLVRAADLGVHVVNFGRESVRWKPPGHSVHVKERSVDFFGRRAEHPVKLDRVGDHA